MKSLTIYIASILRVTFICFYFSTIRDSDMFVLRLLVRFATQPLHYFGLWAIGTFTVALGLTFVAFVDTSSVRIVNYSTVVMPLVAVLLICLSFYFLMMGLLCELALRHLPSRGGLPTPMARSGGAA